MSKDFSKHSLVFMEIRKPDKVCDVVFLEEWMPIGRRRRTDAPSAKPDENTETRNRVRLISVKMAIIA